MLIFNNANKTVHLKAFRCTYSQLCLSTGAGGSREPGQAGSRGLRGRSEREGEGHRARDVQRKLDLVFFSPFHPVLFQFSKSLN